MKLWQWLNYDTENKIQYQIKKDFTNTLLNSYYQYCKLTILIYALYFLDKLAITAIKNNKFNN